MSRIHEALRKAEQEKAAGSRPQVPTELTGREISRVRYEENVAGPAVIGGQESPAALTFEALMARCPQPRWKPDPNATLFFNPQNSTHGTEEFRTLRSRLYRLRDQRPLRTLLITSPLPKEGKTFVAANLAQAISRQHERRALLIDADLRIPRLHAALGTPLTPGLSDYLKGETDELSIVQRSPQDNLFFIAGGKSVPNPAELIGNGRLKNLLDRLVPVFDWVIIDSPPVILVSDASLLAEVCDGVLMVVRAGVTPFDIAQKACREFRGKPVVGAVLNRVEPGAIYGYYYETYGVHSKNGKDKG